MSEARKLAAILAADVVGYSRLMGADEAGTAKLVRERREVATPIVRAFGGRLVKTTGDGVLLEFPSVVAAVECAIAIQKMMAERNAALPEAKRVLYRMGVNLGDVLIEGDDILGDGVNVAARLEGICEPGGVCVSGSAYEHVRGRIGSEFADLGQMADHALSIRVLWQIGFWLIVLGEGLTTILFVLATVELLRARKFTARDFQRAKRFVFAGAG
jgi:class 3 adenylate cyclase